MSDDRLVLLTVPELALLLRVSRRTVDEMRWSGRGPPFVKVGNKIRYPYSDVQSWASRQQPHLQQQIAV